MPTTIMEIFINLPFFRRMKEKDEPLLGDPYAGRRPELPRTQLVRRVPAKAAQTATVKRPGRRPKGGEQRPAPASQRPQPALPAPALSASAAFQPACRTATWSRPTRPPPPGKEELAPERRSSRRLRRLGARTGRRKRRVRWTRRRGRET